MQEWRLGFKCRLHQNTFTPVEIKKPHDIRLGAETIRLESTKGGVTTGRISFKLPLSVRDTWIVRKEGKKRFEEINAPLMLSCFFIEVLEFKDLDRIGPPKGVNSVVELNVRLRWDLIKETIELDDDHISDIEKNYVIVQTLQEQNTNVEFVNNVYRWVFQGANEREKFFNIWLTFNQIYSRHTGNTDKERIKSFAEVFSQYKDAKVCNDDHSNNISHLLKSTKSKIDGEVISPDADPTRVGWDKVFLLIYCVRKCLFHENKFKPDILKAASEIMTDVVLISLREILKNQKPPALRREDDCNCNEMSDNP